MSDVEVIAPSAEPAQDRGIAASGGFGVTTFTVLVPRGWSVAHGEQSVVSASLSGDGQADGVTAVAYGQPVTLRQVTSPLWVPSWRSAG